MRLHGSISVHLPTATCYGDRDKLILLPLLLSGGLQAWTTNSHKLYLYFLLYLCFLLHCSALGSEVFQGL